MSEHDDTRRLDWLDERVRMGGVPFVVYESDDWIAGFGSPFVVISGKEGRDFWTGATIREAIDACCAAIDAAMAAEER